MNFGQLPKLSGTRLVPILRTENAHLFVSPEFVDPWLVDPEGDLVTSVLKFGARFDLLGLSTTEELLLTGEQDDTDCLDPNIAIDKIYYRAKNGDVHYVDMFTSQGQVPASFFVITTMGDFMRMNVDLRTSVNKYGVPRTLISKAIDFLRRKVFKVDVVAELHVVGEVNLQTGSMQVDFTTEDADIIPLGYTLRGQRVNYNRRPASAGQCPYIG